jgi:hypothetical protein
MPVRATNAMPVIGGGDISAPLTSSRPTVTSRPASSRGPPRPLGHRLGGAASTRGPVADSPWRQQGSGRDESGAEQAVKGPPGDTLEQPIKTPERPTGQPKPRAESVQRGQKSAVVTAPPLPKWQTDTMRKIGDGTRNAVQIGYTLYGVTAVDPVEQMFEVDLKIYCRWHDGAMRSDPDMASLRESDCAANGASFPRDSKGRFPFCTCPAGFRLSRFAHPAHPESSHLASAVCLPEMHSWRQTW